jgi:hypothetical protein
MFPISTFSMNSEPSSLSATLQQKLKQFFQLGLQSGCPRDQPDGPKAVGYGGKGAGGR